MCFYNCLTLNVFKRKFFLKIYSFFEPILILFKYIIFKNFHLLYYIICSFVNKIEKKDYEFKILLLMLKLFLFVFLMHLFIVFIVFVMHSLHECVFTSQIIVRTFSVSAPFLLILLMFTYIILHLSETEIDINEKLPHWVLPQFDTMMLKIL